MDVIAVVIEQDKYVIVAVARRDVESACLVCVSFSGDWVTRRVDMVSAFVCVLCSVWCNG